MNENGFIPVVRRWWWLLALATLGAAIAAHTLAKRQTPTYASTATVLVGPLNTDFGTVRAAGDLGRTYAALAKSLPVLRKVVARTHTRVSATELAADVIATSNDVTRLVTLEVRRSNPRLAATLANGLAVQLADVSRTVAPEESEAIREFMAQSEISSLPAGRQDAIHAAALRVFGAGLGGRVRIVDPAVAATAPIAPKISLLTVLGGLAGLALSSIFALLKTAGGGRRRSDDQALAELDGVPFFGTFDGATGTNGTALAAEGGTTRAAETYRLLATKIGFFDGRQPVKNLVVFGADGERASAAVSANLASVLADGHSRVLLVDAACGTVTKLLGLEGRPGYADLLRNGADDDSLPEELRIARSDRLAVIPVGQGPMPTLLEAERARRMLAHFGREADVVLLNAPPIDRSPVGLVWARVADGTVVVAEGDSREAVEEAASSLALVDAKLLGTVVGRARRMRVPRLRTARAKDKEAA